MKFAGSSLLKEQNSVVSASYSPQFSFVGMHIKYMVTAVFLLSISLVRRMNSAAPNEQLFSVSLSPHCSTCSPMPCLLCAIQTQSQRTESLAFSASRAHHYSIFAKKFFANMNLIFCHCCKYWDCDLGKIDSRLYANLRLQTLHSLQCTQHSVALQRHSYGSLPCAGMPGTHGK